MMMMVMMMVMMVMITMMIEIRIAFVMQDMSYFIHPSILIDHHFNSSDRNYTPKSIIIVI